MSWIEDALDGLTGEGNLNLGRKNTERGLALQKEAEGKRTDMQLPQELIDALGIAKGGIDETSPLGGLLQQKADKVYGRRLSNINRNATSGYEAQVGAEGANEDLSNDYNDAAIAGTQATQNLRQQNKASYYGLSGQMADQRSQQYQNNVLLPYLQRLSFSQSQLSNGMNQQAAGLNQAGGLLGSLVKSVGSAFI